MHLVHLVQYMSDIKIFNYKGILLILSSISIKNTAWRKMRKK